MYRRSLESRMRSGTRRGVSKCPRRKDRYIGRLYSDLGKVPSDSGIFRSTGELREFVLGLNGPYGKGEKGPKGWPHPSPWTSPNWTREGGAPFLLSPSPFPFPTPTRKGGVLLPVGVGLPPWRALLGRPPPPPWLLYIRGRGAPHDTQVDLQIVP